MRHEFVAALALALTFNAIAGFNDGGNLLAMASAGRTVPVRAAGVIIVACVILGPVVFGTHVAQTIGTGIVDYGRSGSGPLIAGLCGAIAVVLGAYVLRLPTSMGVALVSSMVGASLSFGHGGGVSAAGLARVAIATGGAIAIGFIAGALIYALLLMGLRLVDRRTGDRLMHLQFATVAFVALGYGANDAEKSIGLIAVAASLGSAAGFRVEPWMILASAAAFAVGLTAGGMRIAKTIGGKLFVIRPEHALAFQLASGVTIATAALLGGPLSTTETTASAIMGVGASDNPRTVRWRMAAHIIAAWLVTIPAGLAAGALASLAAQALR